MAKKFDHMENSNRSTNPSIHDMSDPGRRVFVRTGVTGALAGLLGPLAAGALGGCASTVNGGGNPASMGRGIGFKSVPMVAGDRIVVPEGYTANVLYRWGDPVGIAGRTPAFAADGTNSAADQALQAGMHHDGMSFFPLEDASSSERGLLVMNHEYVDDGLLHADGMKTWNAEKVRKSMNAHGVSVIEVRREAGAWKQVTPSSFARRVTASTPMQMNGPAAGHAMLKTAADPTGTRILGTFNNCANGQTPWGTYLTCEENFADYFAGVDNPDAHQKRWGMRKGNGAKYRWHEHEERFDLAKHPNEQNRFGWVVEIDPQDSNSTPIKRSALGRAAHEGAACALTADGRAVVYMGEDARFEYIYKFVSRDRVKAGGFAANRELLDHGTLYVARFDVDGSGEWLPLVQGKGPLTQDKGFANQGDVLIKSRQASDLLGATKMDRPEWTAVDPISKEVYCTLTNNSNRGAQGQPFMDAANPRANNTMGQIIRWKESGDLDATKFAWNHLVLAGDPKLGRYEAQGNVTGDFFGSPDGLRVDARGVLWIQTDASTSTLGKGDYTNLPNNQMLACDPTKGEFRRFLVGPAACEVTGIAFTPDLHTVFVNIQHPGESANARSNPDQPLAVSRWPDGNGRPRSSTVVITRNDGGVIGS